MKQCLAVQLKVLDFLVGQGIKSKGEARRLIKQGAIDFHFPKEFYGEDNKYTVENGVEWVLNNTVVKIGKRKYVKIIIDG